METQFLVDDSAVHILFAIVIETWWKALASSAFKYYFQSPYFNVYDINNLVCHYKQPLNLYYTGLILTFVIAAEQ